MDEQNTTRPTSSLKRNASDHLVSCLIDDTQSGVDTQQPSTLFEEAQSTAEPSQSHAEVSLPLSVTPASLDLTLPPTDQETLKWTHERWSSHRWFALTVRFDMFTVDAPMPSRCHGLFDSFVVYKVRKLIGVKHRPILFMREYELGMDGNGYCHHIHAVIGVEKGARIDRLTEGIQKALVGSGKGRVHGVRLDELITPTELDAAYSYMRKRKWHKEPFV